MEPDPPAVEEPPPGRTQGHAQGQAQAQGQVQMMAQGVARPQVTAPQTPATVSQQHAKVPAQQQVHGTQTATIYVPKRHYVNPICLAPGQIAPGAPIPGLTTKVQYKAPSTAVAAKPAHKAAHKKAPVMSYSTNPGVIVYDSAAKPYATVIERTFRHIR